MSGMQLAQTQNKMIMVDMDAKPIPVVVVPLPAQGHLNQFLHLARHLAARNIPVHYVGSVAHNRQARERALMSDDDDDDDDKIKLMIHFHDIHLPPYPTPPPNPNSGIRFPTHLQPTFDACLHHFTAPVSSLLLSLTSSSRRVTVIHDATMSFVTRIAASFSNIETYAFHPVSAYTTLFFHLQSRSSSSSSSSNDDEDDDDDDLTFKDCFSDEFVEFVKVQHGMTVNDHGRLLNTCRVIEGEFIDRAMQEPSWKGQKVFALGPLNPITVPVDVDSRYSSSSTGHQCMDWLRSQPQKSVVYVSFGTTTTLCREQMAELAKGLEESNHRFIWVVREADRGDIYASAPADQDDADHVDVIVREYSTAGKGFVVRGWAPQVEILGHVATAGFLSHCGWNSCMESLSMGVPLLTWPMHSDQPRNTVLVTRVLKAGMVVRDWRRRDEILPAAAIRDSVRRLMEEEEGKEVARRAMEVGELIRDCGRKKEELESFVQYINRP